MKKIVVLVVGMMVAVPMVAATPNPADFPLTVHVTTSEARLLFPNGGTRVTYQVLEAVIDGEQVQLSGSSQGVLALGDYKAKPVANLNGPRHPNTYDVYRGYDLVMPDGEERNYVVTRLGPVPGSK